MWPFSKRSRVARLAQRGFEKGFWAGVGGMGGWLGTFAEGPQWWEDVYRIAYDAGAAHAESWIARRSENPGFPEREVPPRVLADCLGAASR